MIGIKILNFLVPIHLDALILTFLWAINTFSLVSVSFVSFLWFSEGLKNSGVRKAAFGMQWRNHHLIWRNHNILLTSKETISKSCTLSKLRYHCFKENLEKRLGRVGGILTPFPRLKEPSLIWIRKFLYF